MKKERLVGIIMSIIISAVMGVVSAALVIKNNPEAVKYTPVAMLYISNIALSIVIGVIIALVIPLGKLGAMLARKANANPPGIKFFLLNAIPNSVGNTLIISLILSFVGVLSARMKLPAEALSHLPPFALMWLGSWMRLLLPTLLISYVLSVLLSPLISRLLGVKGPGPKRPE
jgi:hypothetical protein